MVCARVADAAAIDLLHEQVRLAHAVIPHIHLRCNSKRQTLVVCHMRSLL